MSVKPRRRHISIRSFYRWHRRVGIAAACFAILLAITGLMLNHTERLNLHRRMVDSPWLLKLYGMAAANNIAVGMVTAGNITAIALADKIILLQENNDAAETINSASIGIDGIITGIGKNADGEMVIKTSAGIYGCGDDFIKCQPVSAEKIEWSGELTDKAEIALQKIHRGDGLPLSRIILDIHTGAILGGLGRMLMDSAAVALLILSASGVYMWVRVKK